MRLRRFTCRVVRDLLPLHVGGDLPPEQAEPVDEHLHACLTCFREYRELLAVRGHLGVLADQPLPAGILDGFADDVMARIALAEKGPAAELPGRPQRLRQLTRYAAAAVLILALTLGVATFGSAPGGPVAGAPHSTPPVVEVSGGVRAAAPLVASNRLRPEVREEPVPAPLDAPRIHRVVEPVGLNSAGSMDLPYVDGHADGASALLVPWTGGLVPEFNRRAPRPRGP